MIKKVNAKEIIGQARQGFDDKLHTDEYRRIHSDEVHLNSLMNLLEVLPDKKYMDLGTGNGYLAFEMAKRYPGIQVTGVDIAKIAIQKNQEIQQEREITNLGFMTHDGIRLPFINESYWGIISRFAFHHFPEPMLTIREMYRVLEKHGFVIISDPRTYDGDANDFIDEFQKLKKDGHVHFYRQHELDELFHKGGFTKGDQFQSEFSYPRGLDIRYQQLFKSTSKSMLDEYQVFIDEKLVYITVAVTNVVYRKMSI
jgi:ubiquinone/menaquinone biosynthesis C-methylase UbiE